MWKPAWWWRVVPSCMAPPLPLDQAVNNITELKARVQDVSQRNMRCNLINDSGSKTFVAQPHPPHPPITGAAEFDMLAQAKDAAKKQHVLWKLTDLINRQDRALEVISLWGTGGDLGMTSIVRKAYVDPEIRRNFTCRAWVKIMHPFNPDEFIRSFLAQLHARSRQKQRPILGVDVLKRMKMEAVPEHDLADKFMRQVCEHRPVCAPAIRTRYRRSASSHQITLFVYYSRR
ncbi:uncharacterized protein [Triticum aestivum]|uniref:uncharacterized protein n=1 Tax=Triticum aestivum TaxID=4565 RepID=UPI001D02A451|nr:uncharacterized protein LOC123184017 [Triticum aestivum]